MSRFVACHFVQSDLLSEQPRRQEAHPVHELIYAVRGTYRAAVGRRQVEAEPGSYVVYPAGQAHRSLLRPDWFTVIIALQWEGDAPAWGLGPHPDRANRLQQLLEMLADIRDLEPGPLHAAYLRAVLAEVDWQVGGGEITGDRIERIRRLLDEFPHMAISLAFLCGRFDIARSTLQRQFRERTGLSPLRYLQRSRAKRAVRLLHEGQPSAAVAEAVGVKTVPALSRLLKREYDRGIGDFRREGRR